MQKGKGKSAKQLRVLCAECCFSCLSDIHVQNYHQILRYDMKGSGLLESVRLIEAIEHRLFLVPDPIEVFFFFVSSPNAQGFHLTMISRDDVLVSSEFFCYRTDLKPEKLQATAERPARRASAATFSEIPLFLEFKRRRINQNIWLLI